MQNHWSFRFCFWSEFLIPGPTTYIVVVAQKYCQCQKNTTRSSLWTMKATKQLKVWYESLKVNAQTNYWFWGPLIFQASAHAVGTLWSCVPVSTSTPGIWEWKKSALIKLPRSLYLSNFDLTSTRKAMKTQENCSLSEKFRISKLVILFQKTHIQQVSLALTNQSSRCVRL